MFLPQARSVCLELLKSHPACKFVLIILHTLSCLAAKSVSSITEQVGIYHHRYNIIVESSSEFTEEGAATGRMPPVLTIQFDFVYQHSTSTIICHHYMLSIENPASSS